MILNAKTAAVYVLTEIAREDNADIWDEGFRLSMFVVVDYSLSRTWYGVVQASDDGIMYAAGRYEFFEDDLQIHKG